MKTNLPVAAVFTLFAVGAGPLPVAFSNAPPAPASGSVAVAAPRSVVRFALRIERAAATDAAAGGTEAPVPNVLGTPVITTFDRDTATVAVTNTAFSYSIALSPVVEAGPASANTTTNAGVQTSWNVRLNGKSLPAGTTAVTLTGATRLATGKNALLVEISLRDAETGKSTIYRVWATATLPPADAPSA